MRIGFLLIALFSLVVIVLVARIDRPRKKRHRITGRGGDFES